MAGQACAAWFIPPGDQPAVVVALRHAGCALLGAWTLLDRDRDARFADPVPHPPGRPASDRLLALTGRSPDWRP